MSKNLTRSKSVMDRFRGRGAQHVTDDIPPPKIRDVNKFQKFESGREDPHKLPERPSTSGGTKKSKGNALKRANTVKRETRDDLFFNPLRAHGIDGSTFYDFPLPSNRPPPSPIVPKGIDGPDFYNFPLPSIRPPTSPIVPKGIDGPTFDNFPLPSNRPPPSPVVPKVIEPLPRPKSPDSIKATETLQPNISEVEIGMALGSPSHPPESTQQDQQSYEVETPSTPHPMDDMSFNADSVDAPKQKKGRKWFGLFGTKKEKTATPFYQVKPESQQEIPMSDPSSPEAERGRSRGRSTSSATRKKPDIKRAQTAPMAITTPVLQFPFQASSLSSIHASTLTTIETSDSTTTQASNSTTIQASTSTTIRAGTPDIRVQDSIEVEAPQSYPKAPLESPKLALALPSAEMERYSVMFGQILQNPSIITPSLLQRRQATLNRLKSEEEALAKKEAELEARKKALSKRRGTSPEPNHNNSSFSLFPNTPSRQGYHENSPTRERSPLNRSNTTPAYLSPNRPSFATGLENDRRADLVSDDETLTDRHGHEHQDSFSSTSTKKPSNRSRRSSSSSPRSRPPIQMARTWSPDKSQPFSPSSAEDSEADAGYTNGQRKEDVLYCASPLTATKSRFDEKGSTWQMINSKKQNRQAPSSVSGSTTSEASTVSSSHSNSSFSSVPGGSITISMPMPERENMRERGSMKTPANNQASRNPKEMKIPIKFTPGPRPIISSFNTTTRSSGSAPRPPLKSPMFESQGLRPRPAIQRSASTASPVAMSHRPPLRISSMASANNSSTSISTPRKIPLPVSPRPHPHRFIATPISSPQPEPSYISHQKQESTYSITPSLLDVQIDDHLDVPGAHSRDPEQKRLESAAGVSIARQISVSRQQRQLLIPIKTSGTISRKNPGDRSPGLKSPFDIQSERSPIPAGFGARRTMTGGDASEKKDSPLESFAASNLPGGLLSNQNGSDVRGIRIPISHPRGRTGIQQSSKPSTPTLMVVPDAEEPWGTGNSNGLMTSRDKVEAMMKGSRGSPAMVNSEWEEKGMKMNVSPRI